MVQDLAFLLASGSRSRMGHSPHQCGQTAWGDGSAVPAKGLPGYPAAAQRGPEHHRAEARCSPQLPSPMACRGHSQLQSNPGTDPSHHGPSPEERPP